VQAEYLTTYEINNLVQILAEEQEGAVTARKNRLSSVATRIASN